MTHADPAHSHAADSPFTATEIEAFRRADFAAGRNVVCLMLGIFLIGIALYLCVDYFVAQG
jgi:hypothetical protein